MGDRLQVLLDQKKGNTFTSEEMLELAAIDELDELFIYVNAVNSSL
jgi:hypothetical protein